MWMEWSEIVERELRRRGLDNVNYNNTSFISNPNELDSQYTIEYN